MRLLVSEVPLQGGTEFGSVVVEELRGVAQLLHARVQRVDLRAVNLVEGWKEAGRESRFTEREVLYIESLDRGRETVLNSRTTNVQKCEAVPKRARI